MQPNPIPGQANDAPDRRYEAAILGRILWLHPTHLTERELLLSVFAEGAEVDACERAVRDLVSVGLLRWRESRSSRPLPRWRPGRS
jgi:hypothetical protein